MPHNDDNIKMILEILQAIWTDIRRMNSIMLRILQNQGAPDDVSALQGQNTAALEEDPITDEEEHWEGGGEVILVLSFFLSYFPPPLLELAFVWVKAASSGFLIGSLLTWDSTLMT